MSKKHDENKDVKCFSRIGKVNFGDKTLQVSKSANVGIHMWGRIDFLTKYCGWHFIWNNNAVAGGTPSDTSTTSKRELKKAKKEPKLTDKTKKKKK